MIPAALIVLLHLLSGVGETAETLVRVAAEEHLRETYPVAAPHLDVRVTRLSTTSLDGPLRVALRTAGVPRAHTKVDLLQRRQGVWRRTGWALLYVAHFDSVAVAVRDLARGKRLEESDVTAAWIETTRFHGDPVEVQRLREMQKSSGVVAERRLSAGTPLRSGDVRPPWAVDTGDKVAVRYAKPGFAMELSGRAREPGAVNDEIRVYCSDTEATYRVRLTAPGRADWVETL